MLKENFPADVADAADEYLLAANNFVATNLPGGWQVAQITQKKNTLCF